MLDARIFTFCIFANQDGVHVVIGGFVPGDGFAGADVSEEIECAAEGEVKRNVAFANWSLRRQSLGSTLLG